MQLRRKTSHWILDAKVSRGDFDLALGLLYQCGLTSSQRRRGPGRIRLSAALPPALAPRDLRRHLRDWERSLGRPLFHEAVVQKVLRGDWSRKYQRYLKPFVLVPSAGAGDPGLEVDPRGRLPRHLRPNTLYIEAGLAFGTGTHTTTRLAAELLAEALAPREKPSVLDVGCGTGILAMAAVKMGAKKVVAVDNDPEARITAQGNFRRNRIRGIELRSELRGLKGKYPAIVSNIGLNVLLELKAPLLRLLASKGDLILTGLLYRDVAELLRAYRGLAVLRRCNRAGWAALWLRK